VNDHTSEQPRVKRCSKGDQCIHPDGPELPVTAEYFYINQKGGPSAMCRECAKEYRRQHHQRNKDHDNARSRQYAKEHRGQFDHYNAHYHARKLQNGGSYTHDDLDMLYKQQKGCCWYCGKFVGLTFDIDHRVPVSRGGSSDISNIVIACRECNDSKGNKLPHEWSDRLL
jgi:5-methylcytosine-specific restriction endonuclease McrA